jgi:cytochrome c peroxidase
MALKKRAVAARIAWLVIATSCATAPPPYSRPRFLPLFTSAIPLPPRFAPPPTPADNPLTIEKIELGRHLFYDRRLSANRTQSCASCHQQHLAFSDGRRVAIGSTGNAHFRNTMTLANVAYRLPLTWADPDVRTLEEQVLVPLTNHAPVEMAMRGRLDELLARLSEEPRYAPLFAAAFPADEQPITITNVARAIASFERSLVTADSLYDRLVSSDEAAALSPEAWRGMRLFFSARLGCSSCHGGTDFATPASPPLFRSNGLYDFRDRRAAPRDRGLADKGGRRRDAGKFRIPTLRNVALTAPYMHDGSVDTLAEVIDDYAAGGRAARLSGQKPRRADIRAFTITEDEKRDLLAFLESLTDRSLTTTARFSNPWIEEVAR